MTDLDQPAPALADLEADPGLRRHRFPRLAGAAGRSAPSRASCRRRWGGSPANRPCRRARDAPTPAFMRSARWPAFALAAPDSGRKTCSAPSTGRLPPSIRVLEARTVPSTFHARHSAVAKTYEYRVFRGAICPPFLARYVYACSLADGSGGTAKVGTDSLRASTIF